MKSYLTLAWKELKAQKITAVLILIAVVMSTVMTTIVTQSIGILQSMRVEQAAGLNGNRYATFHQLDSGQAEKLHEDSRLYDVVDIVNVGNLSLGNSGLSLYLREYHGRALEMYPSVGQIREGRLPEKANEIALPEDALRYLGADAAVGDILSLELSAGVMDGSVPAYVYRAEFTLTGILESSYVGYATGTVEGIAGNGTAENLLPEEYLFCSTDFKTHSRQEFQSTVRSLAASLGVEERCIQYNWVLLDALGISYDEAEKANSGSGFPFMVFACILVGVLVLLAAGLVIYNVLKISVSKRIREYGTLRAIGGERGQVYRLVSLQILTLCGVGIPLGLLFGLMSAKGVLAAATGILNPKVFLADSSEQLSSAIYASGAASIPLLSVSVLITLLFAMLAAFPAARYASHVSPTVAMSGQAVRIRRRVKRTRKIHCFEAYYARLNLKRGRGRTVITVLSLVMSITVFVALQNFSGLLDASRPVQDMYAGDYAITNETAGISREAVAALRTHEAVQSLSTVKLTVFRSKEELPFETNLSVLSHETLQIASLDQDRLSRAANLDEQDRQDLLDGKACLIKNPIAYSYGGQEIPRTSLAVGDSITVDGRTLRVAGLTEGAVTVNNDGFLNGVQIIVSDGVYDAVTGKDRYAEVCPTLKEGANPEAFEAWLEEWCAGAPGTHWLSYREAAGEMAESFEQIRMLCWALILFIGVIGILNIINTVYSNIHTRIGEIGMQRAIGMSAASLYQTFLWEGAYYGIFASLAGALLGYICCVFVGAAQTDTVRLVAFPLAATAEAAVISVAACLLATAVPLRSIARLDIVSSIESAE